VNLYYQYLDIHDGRLNHFGSEFRSFKPAYDALEKAGGQEQSCQQALLGRQVVVNYELWGPYHEDFHIR